MTAVEGGILDARMNQGRDHTSTHHEGGPKMQGYF